MVPPIYIYILTSHFHFLAKLLYCLHSSQGVLGPELGLGQHLRHNNPHEKQKKKYFKITSFSLYLCRIPSCNPC